VVAQIELGGEAGNTQYDPGSHCVIVAVQTTNQLAAIDPATAAIVRRITLDEAVRYPHGVYGRRTAPSGVHRGSGERDARLAGSPHAAAPRRSPDRERPRRAGVRPIARAALRGG